jgi:hypothetical protein
MSASARRESNYYTGSGRLCVPAQVVERPVKRTSQQNGRVMSALGLSCVETLPMRLVSALHDVRSTPKADIRFHRNICSDGPLPDFVQRSKERLLDHLVGE